MIIGLEKHFFCLFESGHFTQVLLYLGRAEQRVHNMRGSRIFSGGGRGGGGVRPDCQKTVWTSGQHFFFSPQLILQFTEGFYYRENYTFPRTQRGPKDPEGSIIFQGGTNFFQGGPISIEAYVSRDFPGGIRTPYCPPPPPPPPIQIRTCSVMENICTDSALFLGPFLYKRTG